MKISTSFNIVNALNKFLLECTPNFDFSKTLLYLFSILANTHNEVLSSASPSHWINLSFFIVLFWRPNLSLKEGIQCWTVLFSISNCICSWFDMFLYLILIKNSPYFCCSIKWSCWKMTSIRRDLNKMNWAWMRFCYRN